MAWKGVGMNCREFDQLTDDFVKGRIESGKLKDFLEHDRTCSRCHDDLEIHFLMSQILQNDDNTSYNLADALREHTQKAWARKRKQDLRCALRVGAYLLVEVVTAAAVVFFLLG